MAGIPIFTRNITGNAIASYDWLDLINGAGYKIFYPTETISGAAASSYVLLTRARDGETSNCYYGTGDLLHDIDARDVADLDFDIPIAIPCIISGTAYLNFSHAISGSTNNMLHRYFVITIRHYNAVAGETDLGTVTTLDRVGSLSDYRELSSIALTSKKFAIGDILRVNVHIWGSNSAADRGINLYYDPASLKTLSDADGRTIGTDFIVDIPFKIDIT